MRLLHTSDWHLGRTLHGFSLREAQERAVEAIVELAIARAVDVVVIAGDVFDRAVPPVESIRLLNSALIRLDDAGMTTIITSGNHDSGDRLATYSGLLRDRVRIVGSTSQIGTAIELSDAHGPVVLYALPYLEPDAARYELGVDGSPLERSHEAVMSAALDLVSADLLERGRPRAVAIGHAFVAQVGRESDVASASERDLSVGGVQVVPLRLFSDRGLQYVAMGHLHRPHVVGGGDPAVVYSGSLLRYSLSEAAHEKSVTIVDLGAPGSPVLVEHVALPHGRGMARLSGPMEDLLGLDFAQHREDFVELTVTDSDYPERMHARLDAVFPWALTKVHEPLGAAAPDSGERGDARGRDPMEVMAQFFLKVTGRPLTASEADVLRETYESVRGI